MTYEKPMNVLQSHEWPPKVKNGSKFGLTYEKPVNVLQSHEWPPKFNNGSKFLPKPIFLKSIFSSL